ncbi:MAG: PQQ-dependent sugar dehydrogenase [Proteobacteria bacterium]|nr:PQQ-dependent sugar dehydrogenase [Pseudomonadota bacterium]
MHVFFKLISILIFAHSYLAAQELVLPEGLKIEIFSDQVASPRQMVQGERGIIFIGSRKSDSIYAIQDQDNNGKADSIRKIAESLNQPAGVSLFNGDLYIAEIDKIWKIADVENWLLNNPTAMPNLELVSGALPSDEWHGWKWLVHDKSGNLYTNIGAPCNVCLKDDPRYASIVKFDGKSWEIVARGVRNSVGFDFHPETGELYFGDNGRDWLGDDSPSCELNRLTSEGAHFGFPYLHDSKTVDPEFGEIQHGFSIQKPIFELGAHVAPTGLVFYDHDYLGDEYKNNIFITLHGSWNRSSKVGYKVLRISLNEMGTVKEVTEFLTGFLEGENVLGRPAAPMVMNDGSLLIADDKQSIIYRISRM